MGKVLTAVRAFFIWQVSQVSQVAQAAQVTKGSKGSEGSEGFSNVLINASPIISSVISTGCICAK